MPCFHPLAGFRSKELNPETGKPKFFVSDGNKGYPGMEYIPIPCGKCIGCRLERSRQWAVRCVHEASLWERNCFITLTFNDIFLPRDGSLDVRYFQKFMKRLRKKFGSGVRFFHCGEYGEQLKRPHFHACLFNFDFPDKVLWSIRNGVMLYRSKILESLWSDPVSGLPYGFATVGDVTFESAAYVARYCVKKFDGVGADKHYNGLKPEYVTMSRRPGIASGWFNKWKDDVFPNDYVVVRGFESKPPRFYDNKYDLTDHENFDKIKLARKQAASVNPDNSFSRLREREVVTKAKAAMLRRGYHEGNSGFGV